MGQTSTRARSTLIRLSELLRQRRYLIGSMNRAGDAELWERPETIPARFEPGTIAALDAWAVMHEVSRSEAIRRLVEIGLKAKR
jgi:hypothetical protein